jgi:hypothetical protein
MGISTSDSSSNKGITDIGIHYIDLSLTVSDTSSQCEQFHNNKICLEYSIFGYFLQAHSIKKTWEGISANRNNFYSSPSYQKNYYLLFRLILVLPIDIIISYRMK